MVQVYVIPAKSVRLNVVTSELINIIVIKGTDRTDRTDSINTKAYIYNHVLNMNEINMHAAGTQTVNSNNIVILMFGFWFTLKNHKYTHECACEISFYYRIIV